MGRFRGRCEAWRDVSVGFHPEEFQSQGNPALLEFFAPEPLDNRIEDQAKRLTPRFSLPLFTYSQPPMPPRTLPEKEFRSHAPGYWQDKNVTPEQWNSHTWQLKNRVTTLAGLEEHLTLS